MRLRYHRASPFVRKVVVAADELGLLERIELMATRTRPPISPDLRDDNPLGKVPALITDDGTCLYDSAVICEYLDAVAPTPRLFPPPGPPRWEALRLAALGDGMIGTL
jgi:glutathione S-transferase